MIPLNTVTEATAERTQTNLDHRGTQNQFKNIKNFSLFRQNWPLTIIRLFDRKKNSGIFQSSNIVEILLKHLKTAVDWFHNVFLLFSRICIDNCANFVNQLFVPHPLETSIAISNVFKPGYIYAVPATFQSFKKEGKMKQGKLSLKQKINHLVKTL